ncbi:MAG: aspartyl protease family protein [Acidobacteria bacterium]|nr:aspartyl protease family protein [Acidobacteriota bacterium]
MKTSIRKPGYTILAILICLSLSQTALSQSRDKTLKGAEKEMRLANFAAAEKIYRQLLDKDQNDKVARLGLSFTLVKMNKFLESFQQAAQVIAADPLNSRAYALLGTSLLRSGEFRDSIEALATAVKFNNREALAITGLAEVEYFENRSRNAYDLIKRAIQLDPMEPDYYLALARTCSRLEYYTEAADGYQRFLEVAPKTDAERRARIRGLIDFYRYLGSTKIHRTAGKELSLLPFTLVNHRPFVNVMINGKGPLKFVVDTGASLSVISDKAAERMGIRPVARGGNARAIGGSGTFPIIYGLLDAIQIGEARIESVPVYIRTVHSAPDTPEEERADGYIGLSVLANFAVTLDYQAKQMTLDRTPIRVDPVPPNKTEPGKPDLAGAEQGKTEADKSPAAAAISGGIEIPIRSTSGGLASAETHLPSMDRPLNFIIDTGATVSVVSKASVQRHRLEGLKLTGETYRVIGAAGIEEGVEALGLETLTVSGLKKKKSRALILDLESVNETSGFEQHGILGGDYLSHFRVVLDLRRYQFRITPQTPAISVAAENK